MTAYTNTHARTLAATRRSDQQVNPEKISALWLADVESDGEAAGSGDPDAAGKPDWR